MTAAIEIVASRLASAKRIAVLTGAGVSRESGIPTFREAQTGLWANYDPQRLATPGGFLSDPPLVWQWYDSRREMLDKAKPNPGHYAIAEMEELAKVVVITQNIDGLHTSAGSTDVVELHGNITRYQCFERRHPAENVQRGLQQPPRCHCGSLLRPAVVWFGEALPEDAMSRAANEIAAADIVLVVGTSGLVQPAASLPFVAKSEGKFVVEINPERTPISDVADIFLSGPSGTVLPELMAAAKQKRNLSLS